MLENPPGSPALSAPTNSKRYVPPNQRSRRKSGDHHRSDGTRSVSDAETSRSSFQPHFVALNGCCQTEAFRLLRYRWESAINDCQDPSMPTSERPVLYRGSIELPHQLLSAPQNQMDFLAELRRAIDNKRNEERE